MRADDAATLALMARESVVDVPRVEEGLKSPDALVRATAARLALTRDVAAVVPQLREALASEKNGEAAREEVRALVILGGDDNVAFAAEQLHRFPTGIDGVFSDAVARLGAPKAIDLYQKHVRKLRAPSAPMTLALWGRSTHAIPTAARTLGAADERAFGALMIAFTESRVVLDPGVAVAALRTQSSEIRADAIWHLVLSYATDPTKIPDLVREAAAEEREGASVDEAFGRELLRRMLGGKPVERKEWTEWLRDGPRRIEEDAPVLQFLAEAERKARKDKWKFFETMNAAKKEAIVVREPSFSLSLMLPPGLPQAMMKESRCGAGWMGTARATVDRVGRVQTLDLVNVGGDRGCKRALEAMLRLTLAEPSSFVAPLAANDLLVVKARGDVQCMDEGPLEDDRTFGPQRIGGAIKAPKVVKRQEPMFPESARRAMKGGSMPIVLESRISKTGCVRDIRLLTQSPWPELNGAAVMALSQWKFEPGTLDGVPVDVIFNLTINFRLN